MVQAAIAAAPCLFTNVCVGSVTRVCVCVLCDSEFERGALVETIRRRVGGRSIEVTMTTVPATAAPAVTASTTYVTLTGPH